VLFKTCKSPAHRRGREAHVSCRPTESSSPGCGDKCGHIVQIGSFAHEQYYFAKAALAEDRSSASTGRLTQPSHIELNQESESFPFLRRILSGSSLYDVTVPIRRRGKWHVLSNHRSSFSRANALEVLDQSVDCHIPPSAGRNGGGACSTPAKLASIRSFRISLCAQ
jgi:hypothetical protein